MKNLLTRKRLLVALVCFCSLVMPVASTIAQPFHFTITSDQRGGSNAVESGIYFSRTLQAINNIVDGPGVFHVSVGDIDYAATSPSNRALIDANFGSDFPWFGVVGNHDAESIADMTWLRNEFNNANDSTNRQSLKDITDHNGPDGSTETTYSWDYGNAHFIVLNDFWNGGTAANSDSDSNLSRGDYSGDIVPALYDWLATDLAATHKPFIFIFVHEPAFPYNHHYGDSLDYNSVNRDAFWSLLESEKVSAVFVGHTHYYFKHRGDVRGHTYDYPAINSWRTQDPNVDSLYGSVWQISTGNAGWTPGGVTAGPNSADNLPGSLQWNGLEFIDVNVTEDNATINVYRDAHKMTLGSDTGLNFVLADTITINGDFLAYNDCVYDPGLVNYATDPCGIRAHYGDPNYITVFGIGTVNTQQQPPSGPGQGYAASSGELIDYTTGAGTGVIATLTQSGGVNWQPMAGSVGTDNWTGGYDTAPDTDAYNTFHGIADMTGTIYYANAAGWYVDVNFTGLNPSKTYTFATSASRAKDRTDANGGPGYPNRITMYTISGVDSATNASTAGTIQNPGNPLRVRFNTGNNHFQGYVARWTGITPGADGSFKVRAEADPNSESIYKAYAFDVLMLREEPMAPDNEPPTPNPMTWTSLPSATGPTSITMTATTATEPNYPPVKYYFECTTDGSKSSNWQVSPTYIANGLNPSTLYTFRVKARDDAPSLNETGWSSEQSATTMVQPPEVSILGSWVTGTTHAKETGDNRALIFIAHGERSSANPSLTSVTYGGKTMTKIVERLQTSGTSSRAYVAAFYLNEADVNTATGSTFVPTWTNLPSPVEYCSVFLENVNQTTLIGATANNGSTSGTTLATSALSTADGDMVIEGSANSNLGTYTANNDFTKDFDSSSTSYDAMDGHKAATGVAETPSITHTVSTSRKALIGFVVQVASVDVPDIVGMTEAEAEAALNAVTLVKGNVTSECSDTVALGNVISSSPIAGTGVLCGSAVDLVISTGPAVVPDVVGMTEAQAEAALIAASLVKGNVTSECSDTAALDDVISSSPAASTVVLCGSAVDLVISTGQPTVPCGIIGMTQADATAVIIGIDNLTVGTVTVECSDTVPAGHVIRTIPPCGTEIPCGSSVDLVISTGPAVVPDVTTGMTETQAEAALIAASLVKGNVTSECSDTVALGNVISSSPIAGTGVLCGSAVDLVISTGPCPRTISGYVTEPDANVPVEGVFVDANNGGSSDTTDANGYYQLTVAYGWSGTVTPSKTGYTFEPNAVEYNNVTTDKNNSYIVIPDTFIISGYAVDSTLAPLVGVLMSPDEGGGVDITDANGYYEVPVGYNWSGNIVPSKYAYAFEPNSIEYTNVTENIAETQDYVGTLLTYTITGYIKNACDVPIADVLVDANNGGNSDTTDANGYYEVWVNYNWSGTVTPGKAHYIFDPNSKAYANVLEDKTGQDYGAANIYDLDCDSFIGLGDIAVICESWLSNDVDINDGDFNDDDIVNFLDFAEFANVWLTEQGK